jgi:hippurate hydrolase
MESGAVRNAVSGFTQLEGTLRTFRDETFAYLEEGLHRICREVETESGCKVNMDIGYGYPPVYNDPSLLEKVQSIAKVLALPQPSMITEDFSWYQQEVPGVFFFLGTGRPQQLHAVDFDFDPEILLAGADLWETLATKLQF